MLLTCYSDFKNDKGNNGYKGSKLNPKKKANQENNQQYSYTSSKKLKGSELHSLNFGYSPIKTVNQCCESNSKLLKLNDLNKLHKTPKTTKNKIRKDT